MADLEDHDDKKATGNQGHTYGDVLSEADRTALLEYLKSL